MYPNAPLPSELSGQPTISSKNMRQSAFNAPYPYVPSPFAGWPPYLAPGSSNILPYPPWPVPGPSHTPFHPLHPPSVPSNVPTNPSANEEAPPPPSDDDRDFEYPTISDFFEGLMATESGRHYFTNYTDSFHNQGYYRVDELADESLTVEHMVKMIENLKDGTARVIKNKALEKVRQIRKGKGRVKK
ncbi:hypothetical protein BDM02DRAFT_3225543 [Thelephora ganbajun]|uniref:Uncharacterized protein n=1 Tax=Thelephora ganbajun TaxID=370292 RepID=A0ACB6ZV27_THEGA|nr:hypothetical protein BDM02DRAFT_3225543 [Thelephora ganbajun]